MRNLQINYYTERTDIRLIIKQNVRAGHHLSTIYPGLSVILSLTSFTAFGCMYRYM